MEYREVVPLPSMCRGCKEAECYNCDYARLRWELEPTQELLLKKKLKEQAIRRLQKEIDEIDRQLKNPHR